MAVADLVRRVRAGVALGAAVAGLAAVAPNPVEAGPVEDLRAQIHWAIGGSSATASTAQVTIGGLGQVVFLRPYNHMAPASTQKLYTAGAALLELGPNFRMRTEVRATAPTVDGVLAGDLVLVGGADPTLTGFGLQVLANTMRDNGLRRVTGALWVDDSMLDRTRRGPGWKWHYVPSQSGPLSAVSVDRNRYRTDSTFIADPARFGGERLRDALRAAGVAVDGPTHVGRPPTAAPSQLAVRESPPMRSIVASILKYSDNFAAEELLKYLGTRVGAGTHSGGIEVVNIVNERLGMVRQSGADGSGLSTWNRQTANHEVTWLWRVGHSPVGEAFRSALPVACVDGTLRTRMCNSPAAGRVFAKTGTLPGVVTLAGYTTTRSGRPVAFSFLLSGVRNVTTARNAIDRAVIAIASSHA